MPERNTPESPKLTGQRVACFDIARGIGILLMVMGHIGFGDTFNKVIHTFHMPLFFFLSGYFYRPEKFAGMKGYCMHQVRTLLLPYIVFCMFYQPLHVIYTGEFSFQYFLLSLVSSNHNRIDVAGAMWFLLCLFSAKMIYYFLDTTIKNRKALLSCILVLTLCGNFMRMLCMLPFAIDSALSCLAVIHFGVLAYRYRDEKFVEKIFHAPWWGCVLLFVMLMVTGLGNQSVIIRRNHYGIVGLYWISCLSGILLVMNVASWIDCCSPKMMVAVSQVLSFFGRESLVYLVLNELTIYTVELVLIGLGVSRTALRENYVVQLITVVGTMAVLAVVSLVVEKTPIKVLFGKRWKKA